MKTNRYFIATLVSGLIVALGLAGLAVKGFYPAYHEFLAMCGLQISTCQQVLNDLNPINIFAVAAITWIAVAFVWQFLKTQLILHQVMRRFWPAPSYLSKIAFRAGLGNRIKVVDGSVLFCSGLLRPQIVIGREIMKSLSLLELEAAIVHESYHLKNRDPLKVFIVTSLSRGLFFLPAISALSKLYLREKEVAADLLAEEKVGRVFLTKALYKVLQRSNPLPQSLPALVPSFASLDIRGVSSPLPAWTWTGAVIIAIFFMSVFVRAVHATGGC